MNTHRHAQLAATFKQRVHACIVRVHAEGSHGVRNEALSLVMKFTNPAVRLPDGTFSSARIARGPNPGWS